MKYAVLLAVGLATFQAVAQPSPVQPPTPPSAGMPPGMRPPVQPPPVAPDPDKLNTALGIYLGTMIKNNCPDADIDTVAKVMKSVIAGEPHALKDQEIMPILQGAAQYNHAKLVEKNKIAGEEFLAKNAKNPDVKTFMVTNFNPMTQQTTTNEMQYIVLTDGAGAIPIATDTVTVNYRGTLIDGTEFDSSYSRNEPFTTMVGTGIIKGWQEALKRMKVGSKWKIFVPSDLAYAERGSPPKIQPNATLIFEIELLSIKEQAKPPGFSSDIIHVPSAEEVKKGAQIETIKADQLPTNTNSATNK